MPYKRLVLVVQNPNGKLIRKAYEPGNPLAYEKKLTDGLYKYELIVVPNVSPDVRKALKKARATNDRSIMQTLRATGMWPKGPHKQSGSFRVHGGAVISPQQKEPTSKRKQD